MFEFLKDLHARAVQSSKCQEDLAADVKEIKTCQKSIEGEMASINSRLDALEKKSGTFEHFGQELSRMEASVEQLATANTTLTSRLDELEDRSRRDNLIFHGIADSKESWEQTEIKLLTALTQVIDSFPTGSIERAHRLGTYSPGKCRPIIAKFSNYKVKEKTLSFRTELKTNNITVSEDFSLATRNARKKLLNFGKSWPGSPKFQLRHNKLFVNKKCFIYDATTDSVQQIEQRDEPVSQSSEPPQPMTS
ncbi:uncharacterized protein LOC144173781 [Haemaphysalis longicornis]